MLKEGGGGRGAPEDVGVDAGAIWGGIGDGTLGGGAAGGILAPPTPHYLWLVEEGVGGGAPEDVGAGATGDAAGDSTLGGGTAGGYFGTSST